MMKKILHGLALLVLATSFNAPSHARVTTTAKVRYETNEGRSKWYTVDVHFFTGGELAQATNQWSRFSSFKKYAVIFWAEGEATIIEISTLMLCSGEFTTSCMPMLGRIKGKDQDDDEWEVCTSTFCG